MQSSESGPVESVRAAASRIGVSPFTIRSWMRQRRIPYFRVGRRIVIAVADVEAFLAAHRVEACGDVNGFRDARRGEAVRPTARSRPMP